MIKRLGTICGGVVFILPLLVYMMTLAPTITWRNEGADGGDLIAAAHVLGIAHPSGYPTYVLIGKLFTLFPLGDVAYRLNLMSALFAAATVITIYLFTKELSTAKTAGEPPGVTLAAGTAALLFAFSPTFWSQAVIAEVYTLNAFFVGIIILLLVRLGRERRGKCGHKMVTPLVALGLLYGLSLGNHLTMLLLAPPLLFYLLRETRPTMKEWGVMGGAFLLGFSVYLLLPWRAMHHPSVNWGDPHTLDGFLWTVTGTPYRHFVFFLPAIYWPTRVAAWVTFLVQQFSPLGLPLGLWGLVWHWHRYRPFAFFSLLFFTLTTLYALGYNTTDSYIYLIPSYWVFAVWIGGGLSAASERLETLGQRSVSNLTPQLLFGVISLLLLPLPLLLFNYPAQDLSHDHEAYDYGRSVLGRVEERGIIIADTDRRLFTLWYFRYAVGQRRDVVILARGLYSYPWYRKNLRQGNPDLIVPEVEGTFPPLLAFIEANLSDRAIYLTDDDSEILARYLHSRAGTLWRLERTH